MQVRSLVLWLMFALLSAAEPGLAQAPAAGRSTGVRPSLSGGIEKNNGRLRLFLTNDSPIEFQGRAVIAIGSDSAPREIGQVAVTVGSRTTSFLQFSAVSAPGNEYLLKVFDLQGALIVYKSGPIKSVSDGASATEAALTSAAMGGNPGISAAPAPAAPAPATPAAREDEMTIRGRLVAGEKETDPPKLAFEIKTPNAIREATLAITLGKHKSQQTLDLEGLLVTEFKLPEEVDGDKVLYLLKSKDGRELLKGEIKLEQLMAEDYITVSDIRTDRPAYDLGDPVKLSLFLDGQSPHGYRLEVQARDARGAVFFSDQRQSKGGDKATSQEFSFTLPGSGETPIILEFKIFDGETGLLFDSGEREIPINAKS
ncbi:MAG: hypothetical protein SF339_09965 [Blastocatellia bacterium]|nr:hypothetical protein [Blastocatellia bacterium]